MTDCEIVRLSPDEWALYKQIRLEALKLEQQAFGSRYEDNIKYPEAFWRGRLEDAQAGENLLLFARQGDRLVGLIGTYADEEKGVVNVISVYVAAEARGQGIGAALMEAILAEVRKQGTFRKARLMVNADQAAAFDLYRRFGFEVVGEETNVLGDGLSHLEYVMEKDL